VGQEPLPTAEACQIVICSLAFLFRRFAQSSGVRKAESRLQVPKTYQLFIGGKFVRGDHGRVHAALPGGVVNVLAGDRRGEQGEKHPIGL
jgi:hypothetical protein